ncbi:MAG: signal peptide peptidase SppA [Planctomycetota bacterium]
MPESSPPGPQPPIDPTGVATPPPPPPGYYPAPAAAPAAKGGLGTVLLRVGMSVLLSLFLLSVVANVYQGVLIASLTTGLQEARYAGSDTTQGRVVILPVEGVIDATMAEYVRDAVDSLLADPPKAVVLRVESGGGGVTASDQIWHQLARLETEPATPIPVVASFGNVAASGGYYIAADAEHIMVERTGITGSIGVIAQVPTVEGLLDKVGVQMHTITASDSAEKDVANNPFRTWTPADDAVVQNLVDSMYEQFLSVVIQGRGFTDEQARAVANGAIYTADEALNAKLVDSVGYLDDAIAQARTLGGLPVDAQVTIVTQPGAGLLGALLSSKAGLPNPASVTPQVARSWLDEFGQVRLAYLTQWVGRP